MSFKTKLCRYFQLQHARFIFQLVEQSKQKGEKELLQKREKVQLELEKLQKRVDEFNDYGELDMMVQYVNDVKTVQKRIAELREQVGGLFKKSYFTLLYLFYFCNGDIQYVFLSY